MLYSILNIIYLVQVLHAVLNTQYYIFGTGTPCCTQYSILYIWYRYSMLYSILNIIYLVQVLHAVLNTLNIIYFGTGTPC